MRDGEIPAAASKDIAAGMPHDEPEDRAQDEQHDALMDEYLSNLQSIHEGEIRSAVVVAIEGESVLMNLENKSEGVAPLSEFLDPAGEAHVSVGDKIEVLVQQVDGEQGQIAVSHKAARRMKAMQALTAAVGQDCPVAGRIVRVVRSGLLVDCGVDCFMPASQLDLRRVEDLSEFLGKDIEFVVLEVDRKRGRAVVSRRKHLETQRAKRQLELMASLKPGDVVKGIIRNVLEFGAFVDLGGVDGFIPREEASWEKATSPAAYLRSGQEVEAKVLRVNPETGKITLSRKQTTPDPWESAGLKYPKGKVVAGEVTGLTNFGAFIRLEEGLTGLIHTTDLSWSKSQLRPEELLKEGDTVSVVVLELDSARRRLSLGMKQMREDPWVEAEKKFPPKSKVSGVVTGVTKFGAFVRLDEAIEGLIHVSDFAWDKKLPNVADLAKVGDPIEAIVLKTDKTSRRISLGVKQLTPSPLEAFASRHRSGESVDGKVISLIETGAFLELAPGIEGFLHVSQMSEERIKRIGEVCKVGDEMQVKILRIDVDGGRIALSRKAHIQDEERSAAAGYMRKDEGKGGVNLGELLQNLSLPRSE